MVEFTWNTTHLSWMTGEWIMSEVSFFFFFLSFVMRNLFTMELAMECNRELYYLRMNYRFEKTANVWISCSISLKIWEEHGIHWIISEVPLQTSCYCGTEFYIFFRVCVKGLLPKSSAFFLSEGEKNASLSMTSVNYDGLTLLCKIKSSQTYRIFGYVLLCSLVSLFWNLVKVSTG